MAPARRYIPELLEDVLADTVNRGMVFTQTFALDDIAAAYEAMSNRTAIKAMVVP